MNRIRTIAFAYRFFKKPSLRHVALSCLAVLFIAECTPSTEVDRKKNGIEIRKRIEHPQPIYEIHILGLSEDGQNVLYAFESDAGAGGLYINSKKLRSKWCYPDFRVGKVIEFTSDLKTVAYFDGDLYINENKVAENVGRYPIHLSSDGRVVAYTAYKKIHGTEAAVFVNSRRITDWTDKPIRMVLSSDGAAVAYTLFDSYKGGGVFLNGKQISKWFPFEIFDLKITPDGKTVVYNAMHDVYRNSERIPNRCERVSNIEVTPDGLTVAYSAGDDKSKAVFRNEEKISKEQFSDIQEIDVTSDGRTIIFVARQGSKRALFKNSNRITEWVTDIRDICVTNDGLHVAYNALSETSDGNSINALYIDGKEIFKCGILKFYQTTLRDGTVVIEGRPQTYYNRKTFKEQRKLIFAPYFFTKKSVIIYIYEYVSIF